MLERNSKGNKSGCIKPDERTISRAEKRGDFVSKCYICDASDVKISNYKRKFIGRKNGKRVQKTIYVCNCCGAWMSDEDIKEKVIEDFGWDGGEL